MDNKKETKRIILWGLTGIIAYSTFNNAFDLIQNIAEAIVGYALHNETMLLITSVISVLLYPLVFSLILSALLKRRSAAPKQISSGWLITFFISWFFIYLLRAVSNFILPRFMGDISYNNTVSYYQVRGYISIGEYVISFFTLLIWTIVLYNKSNAFPGGNTPLDHESNMR
jgi:hypothetical protein